MPETLTPRRRALEERYSEGAICPDHGAVLAPMAWTSDYWGRAHLGLRCPECRLWLRWTSTMARYAPPRPTPLPRFPE